MVAAGSQASGLSAPTLLDGAPSAFSSTAKAFLPAIASRQAKKTIIPFALVGYEVIISNSRYALVGYFITSYPFRAHGITVIYIERLPNVLLG